MAKEKDPITDHSVFISPPIKATAEEKAEEDDKGFDWGFYEYCEVLMLPGIPQGKMHEMIDSVCKTAGVYWFKRLPYPHGRVTLQRRAAMIRAGAVPVDMNELLALREMR